MLQVEQIIKTERKKEKKKKRIGKDEEQKVNRGKG